MRIVNGIDHVEVFVRDLAASEKWYQEVFGLDVIHRWDPEPVMIGVGGTNLALFQQSGPESTGADAPEVPAGAWHRVAWRTDPAGFDAAMDRLRQLGIEFRGPVDHEIAQSIYFSDPDGHRLEITAYRQDAED